MLVVALPYSIIQIIISSHEKAISPLKQYFIATWSSSWNDQWIILNKNEINAEIKGNRI